MSRDDPTTTSGLPLKAVYGTDDTAATCDGMDLLAGSAERISVVSVKRAALSTVIITPDELTA